MGRRHGAYVGTQVLRDCATRGRDEALRGAPTGNTNDFCRRRWALLGARTQDHDGKYISRRCAFLLRNCSPNSR